MAYIIAEPCIGTKDTACVDVCPADGKTEEREGQAGAVTWRDAETHASEYIGTGEAHALLVALKGKPHKMARKKKM